MGGLKRQKQDVKSSSEDEFEKEMDMELESVMRSYENDHGTGRRLFSLLSTSFQ